MKNQLMALAFTTLTAFITLPALASPGLTYKGLAKTYHKAYISSFHDIHEAKCVEVYRNGERNETSFEFNQEGTSVFATQYGQENIQYKFTPSFWKSSYIAHGERNGSKFKLHARATVNGDYIIKMTTSTIGIVEHSIGYIFCCPK